MQLTIPSQDNGDRSISLSSYIAQVDRGDKLHKDALDRSDTQLLQSSPIIHENSSFCISSEESIQRPFVLRTHTDSTSFSDLGPQFLIDQQKKNKHLSHPLESICQDLVEVVKNLQAKLQKGDDSLLKSLGNSSNASTVPFSKCCGTFDGWKGMLLQLAEAKGQLKLYASQLDQMSRQMSDMRLENQQNKLQLKKTKTENYRLKELVRQYKNYFRKTDKENISSNTNHSENSLDKRLKEQQRNVQIQEFHKFDSIQSIFSKDTPKTPHNFRYRSCQNLLASQKTQPRTNAKFNQLKQIIEFSERAESNQDIFGRKKNVDKQYKYPFAEMLEASDLNEKEGQSSILALDHFSTMESLPEDPQRMTHSKYF